MDTSYKSIVIPTETELTIKRSRFIGTAHPVEDADNAEKLIGEIKNRYQDASHNCYAYLIDESNMRFSDDGEPQGTAGIPILSVIKKRRLEKVIIIVTRYYGGVKLGSGGLVSAYSAAASTVLEKAGIRIYTLKVIVKLQLGYEQVKIFDLVLNENGATLLKIEYLDTVHYSLSIEHGKWRQLKNEILSIGIKIIEESTEFI